MVRWCGIAVAAIFVPFLPGLLVAPVAAGEGPRAGAPFVFAPVIDIDEDWRAAAAAIAAGIDLWDQYPEYLHSP